MIDILQNSLKQNLSSSTTLLALKEYTDSLLDKFEKVSSGYDNNIAQISLPVQTSIENVDTSVVGRVNANDLHAVLNGEVEQATVFISDSESIVVSADELDQAFQDTVSDLQIQSEFMNTCLSTQELSSADFTTQVTSKYPGVAVSKLKQYSNLFDTGDKITALKSWISQVHNNNLEYESEYITLVDKQEYTGVNVWSLIVDDFINTVTGFFDKVWEGIENMKEFFQNLWNALVRLGKYLISKAFRYLTSNFSNGSSKLGILDFPLFQIKLGTVNITGTTFNDVEFTTNSTLKGWLNGCIVWQQTMGHKENYTTRASSSSNLIFFPWGNADSYPEANIDLAIKSFVWHNNIDKVVNPNSGDTMQLILKPFDVLIPSGIHDDDPVVDGIVIRFGCTPNKDLYLSLYAQVKQQCLDVYDDADLSKHIRQALSTSFTYLKEEMNLPLTFVDGSSTDSSEVFGLGYITSYMISAITESAGEAVDFASHIKLLSITSISDLGDKMVSLNPQLPISIPYGYGFANLIFFGLLPYAALMSPLSDSNDFYYDNDSDTNIMKPVWQFLTGTLYQYPFPVELGNQGYINFWETDMISTDPQLPSEWRSAFKPYISRNTTPASIHLQTLEERAKEIEVTIISALVAAAAIYVSVKLIKFKRKLKMDTEIAVGQRDNFAWNMDPSSVEDQETYRLLRKKARKKERLSNLFGNTSKMASNTASNLINDANTDSINSILNDIYKNITGSKYRN